MRRLASYIRNYGDDDGRRFYHALQSQAAHARWKAFYRDRGRRSGGLPPRAWHLAHEADTLSATDLIKLLDNAVQNEGLTAQREER